MLPDLLLLKRLMPYIFLAPVVLGLKPPVPNPAISLSPSLLPSGFSNPSLSLASLPTPSNTSSTVSSLRVPNLFAKRPRIKCDSSRYGPISSPESCWDAWRDIPDTTDEVLTFGLRVWGFFEVQLPQRFLSCKLDICADILCRSLLASLLLTKGTFDIIIVDGLCSIDITPTHREIHDTASWAEVSAVTAELLDYCVIDRQGSGRSIGGTIGHWGSKGRLLATVRSYEPDVTCDPSRRPYNDDGACAKVIDIMSVNSQSIWFTRSRVPDSGRQIVMPTGGEIYSDRMLRFPKKKLPFPF